MQLMIGLVVATLVELIAAVWLVSVGRERLGALSLGGAFANGIFLILASVVRLPFLMFAGAVALFAGAWWFSSNFILGE